jgi:hypothetical protein
MVIGLSSAASIAVPVTGGDSAKSVGGARK